MPSPVRGGYSDLALASGGGLNSPAPVQGDVAHYLYDDFTTNRSVGAVNNTTSESIVSEGGGLVRTVTDGNSKLSIASSVLTFATGGVGTGNPGQWYPSYLRTPGVIYFAKFLGAAGGAPNYAQFGWDSAQAGSVNDGILFQNTGILSILNNAAGIQVGSWVASTVYMVAVIMRANGMFFFIKGGTFTNWSLLYASTSGNGAGFPEAAATGVTSVFTAKPVRVVTVPTYIPIPFAYDTFTRANGALGNTETVSPDLQLMPVLAWTLQNGTIAVVSNAASITALAVSAIATVSPASADILIAAAVTRTAGVAGVILRYQDANNYVIATHDGVNASLTKVVASVPTVVITAVATYVAGALITVIASGTAFRFIYNGVLIGAGTIADAALQSSVPCGLYGTDLSALFDDIRVWARGTGNEYAALDAYGAA